MEWLNYHHLRHFWTVAKEGSLKKAAEKLHVSQPSISAQLRKLEEVLGEKLFRRSERTKVLTDACRVQFHAITAERRMAHPAVALITEQARKPLFSQSLHARLRWT